MKVLMEDSRLDCNFSPGPEDGLINTFSYWAQLFLLVILNKTNQTRKKERKKFIQALGIKTCRWLGNCGIYSYLNFLLLLRKSNYNDLDFVVQLLVQRSQTQSQPFYKFFTRSCAAFHQQLLVSCLKLFSITAGIPTTAFKWAGLGPLETHLNLDTYNNNNLKKKEKEIEKE